MNGAVGSRRTPEISGLWTGNKAQRSKKRAKSDDFPGFRRFWELSEAWIWIWDRWDAWYDPRDDPISLDFLGFPWIWVNFACWTRIWALRWPRFLDMGWLRVRFPWISLDFNDFIRIFMILRWFCLLIPGYDLSESLRWPDFLAFLDMYWLRVRYEPIPGYDTIWWLWRLEILDFDGFGSFLDACFEMISLDFLVFEMIFLLSGWFWDDFACWLPRFALYIRWFWPFPGFLMILGPIYWILSIFLSLGPFYMLFWRIF